MTFVEKFKKNINNNYNHLWFWDNYKDNASLWIGKCVSGLRIPDDSETYIRNMLSEISDVTEIYIKVYLSKNIYNNQLSLNCFIISDNSHLLPVKLKKSFIYSIFEIYEITENMINNNSNMKSTIGYYLKWNNLYQSTTFIKEIDNIIQKDTIT